MPKIKKENDFSKLPTSTLFYHWPEEGRGEVIVDESDYKRIVELLLHLDFRNLEKATLSTARWIDQTARDARWGKEVGKLVGRWPKEGVSRERCTVGVTNLTGL